MTSILATAVAPNKTESKQGAQDSRMLAGNHLGCQGDTDAGKARAIDKARGTVQSLVPVDTPPVLWASAAGCHMVDVGPCNPQACRYRALTKEPEHPRAGAAQTGKGGRMSRKNARTRSPAPVRVRGARMRARRRGAVRGGVLSSLQKGYSERPGHHTALAKLTP